MPKSIPNAQIFNVLNNHMKCPERDEDGDIIWIDPNAKDEDRRPKLRDAKTADLMQVAALSIPRSISASQDSLRQRQILNALDRVDYTKNGQKIVLKEKVYNWLFRRLGVEVPLTKKQKEDGTEHPMTYAFELWGASSAYVVEQLKTPDERKNLDDQDVEEPEEAKKE